MIRPELVVLARRWAEPALATAATLAALWIAGASTLRWGWLTLVLSAVILVAGGLWIREAIRRVRFAVAMDGAGQVFVEERRVLYVGRLGNVQLDLDDVSRVDLAVSNTAGKLRAVTSHGAATLPSPISTSSGASVMLYADGSPPVSIPLNAEGEDAFLDALCGLPGFRLDDLSGAMTRMTRGEERRPIITIWRR